MNSRIFLLGAAAALAAGIGAGPTQAASEGEIGVLHHACKTGDREACVHFGAALREHHEHEREWRRIHEDWYR